jgi:hypothetical protein
MRTREGWIISYTVSEKGAGGVAEASSEFTAVLTSFVVSWCGPGVKR